MATPAGKVNSSSSQQAKKSSSGNSKVDKGAMGAAISSMVKEAVKGGDLSSLGDKIREMVKGIIANSAAGGSGKSNASGQSGDSGQANAMADAIATKVQNLVASLLGGGSGFDSADSPEATADVDVDQLTQQIIDLLTTMSASSQIDTGAAAQ